MLSGLPETDLPFLLPMVVFLRYLSSTNAHSIGWMESCWYRLDGHNRWAEYGKQVSISLLCPAPYARHSLFAVAFPQSAGKAGACQEEVHLAPEPIPIGG